MNNKGTYILAKTAAAYNAERFLFISTDKAVRPTSVMGASKRLGEMVLRSLSGQSTTKFMSVRFGPVLGSSGSRAARGETAGRSRLNKPAGNRKRLLAEPFLFKPGFNSPEFEGIKSQAGPNRFVLSVKQRV